MRIRLWLYGFFSVAVGRAEIINVPADIDSIQGGINLATDGDTVLVQPGTYLENINYNGKNIVVGSLILIAGDTSYISRTIIDGGQSGSVVTFSSGEGPTAFLQGFTITNGSTSSGGGIYCNFNSSPVLANVRVIGNSASSWGGGIYCDNGSSPSLLNVTVSGNTVDGNGGGICCRHSSNVTLVNVIVSGNSATGYAGGVCLRGNSNPSLINVTVTGNSAGSYSGGIYSGNSSHPVLTNTILWNNPPVEIYLESSSLMTATYSDIQDGWVGSGNIDADPLFVDTTSGAYHLQIGSPGIDAGNPESDYDDIEDPSNPGFALWPALGTLRNDMGAYGGNPGVLSLLAVDDAPAYARQLPLAFTLHPNHPNPFNPATTIQYDLPRQTQVRLSIYDILGREVALLVQGDQAAGYHQVIWNGRNEQGQPVSSGVYLYRLQTGPAASKFRGIRKMLLLR